MNEKQLQYIWQQKLFDDSNLLTTTGERVEILDVGMLNTDSGADMFNAKIRIGETVWAGDVEIHLRSSDWNNHRHDKNPAYNSVILHVVKECDCDVFCENGEKIPQLILPISPKIIEKIHSLSFSSKWIVCEKEIKNLNPLTKKMWMESLLIERLQRKKEDIDALLQQNSNNWEETFYLLLARSFGFGKNSDAFFLLAKSLPLRCLQKHKNNLFQLEAMLFGQSGLLFDTKSTDDYVGKLQKEYQFLSQKFQLKPIDSHHWKMLRLRPVNFPYVRLAQFAMLVFQSSHLFSKVLEIREIQVARSLFQLEASDYWDTHYVFGKESKTFAKKLSDTSIDLLLINVVVPMLFAYGKHYNNSDFCERALCFLEKIKPESNAIISHFSSLNFEINSAADSQAIIQLKQHYCDRKDCLRCRFAYEILRKDSFKK